MKTLNDVFNRCELTGAWYGEKISDVMQRNFMGDTVLHTVCSWGDLTAVKIIVAAGADVNALGDQGSTPLFNAVIGKNVEVVAFLLGSGSDPNKENNFSSLLQYAKNISAPLEIVELLTKYKSKKSRIDNQ